MSEDVHIGKDGWLFLRGGTNHAEEYYTELNSFPTDTMHRWADLLEDRYRKCQAIGVKYFHFLAPDKTSVYPEYYKSALPNFSSHPILVLDRLLSARPYWINVLDDLLSAKSVAAQFYKTDSHWNFNGCYSAYKRICRAIGVEANIDLPNRTRSSIELYMDLGSKLDPKVKETAEFAHILRDAKREFANDIVKYNESAEASRFGICVYNSMVGFRNSSTNACPLRVVLFGDSFCEFRTHALTGMLAETFKELTFVWNHSLDFGFIQDQRPDIVISENVERFVNRVPVDGIDVYKAADQRLQEVRKKNMEAASAKPG